MRKTILFAFIVSLPILGISQETYRLSLDSHQTLDNGRSSIGKLLKLPVSHSTVILAGLNDLDNMGGYFNVYGSKLIVDTLDQSSDGTKKIVLRREDGRDFYDLFPTLTAKLTPLNLIDSEELLSE